MMEKTDTEADYLQQLRWRSRRGLLELELLLLPFARDRLASVSAAERQSYERLLACEDLDIYDWLQQRAEPADASLVPIVELIRAHQRAGGPL
jgi:antitoxin CptB